MNAKDVFDADLVLANAKVERAQDGAKLENWLNNAECMAFLHSPALIATAAHKNGS